MDKKVTRLKDLGTVTDMVKIDPRTIRLEEGHNPRNYALPENRQHLDSLKSSIRENGVLSPLWVRLQPADNGEPAHAILVDGECRWRSVMELIAEGVEIDSVPCLPRGGNNPGERLLMALTANTGKPLSKWEVGNAFKRLHSFGWEHEKIAQRMGVTVRYVDEAIELADAPDAVKTLLSEKKITSGLAIKELRSRGEKATETLKAAVSKAQASGKGVATRERKADPRTSILAAADHLAETLESFPEFLDGEVGRALLMFRRAQEGK